MKNIIQTGQVNILERKNKVGIITNVEIKDIKQLVETLKNRDYKIRQGRDDNEILNRN